MTLRFVVLPDGRVEGGVLVEKTSGFSDFDRNAERALREWRFEPLIGAHVAEQLGLITFHFRLTDGDG